MPQHWSLRDEIKMETQTDCGGGITVQMCSSEVEVPTVFYAKKLSIATVVMSLLLLKARICQPSVMELFVICLLLVTQYKSQFYRLTATKLSSLSVTQKNVL